MPPYTCSVGVGRTEDELVTLVIQDRVQKDKILKRSTIYFWDTVEQSCSLHFDVMPNESTKEKAERFLLSKAGLLVVSLNGEYRLIGWDIATQAMIFDKKPSRNGLGNLVYCILDKRKLIAIGSMGYIDFWTLDMNELVYSFDSGKRDRYYGDMTVSPDERYLAVSTGHNHIYELPDELRGEA